MSYSNTSGGTLTLPSPTHVHHVDVSSAVRSLRRSLSRSPSKFNLAKAASHAPDPSGQSRDTPSPDSPCPPQHQGSSNTWSAASFASATPQQQTPCATPLRSSVKLSLRSARPKATPKTVARPRPPPKSPLKRALNIASDFGNSTLPTTTASDPQLGQENNGFNSFALAFSPQRGANVEKGSRHSMHLDLSGVSKSSASTRFLDTRGDTVPTFTPSPLKRSDAIMNLDQAQLGSPVAKRRSLHGISSFGADFNIFDHAPTPQQNFDIHDDNNSHEYQLGGSSLQNNRETVPSPTPAAMSKRTTSLRKSTLQQRHDPRSSWGRRQGEKYLAQQPADSSTPIARNRFRASLDQFLQPEPRDSPFANRGPLPNPSAHALDRPPHQPHPLSRTLTTSSSSSSILDDSPTHIPVQHPERARHGSFFGKTSLPFGAQRPREPVATPQYKSAKPLQSAFASTGLISKMNRNPEQDPSQRAGAKPMVMPDTPCKKQVYPSNTYPPSSGGSGRKQQRFSLPMPETPFNGVAQRPRGTFGLGTSDKPVGLFKLRPGGHVRKASLLSLEGDIVDYQGVLDGDLPPTPTKSVLGKSPWSGSQVSHATPIAIRTQPPPTSAIGLGIDRRGGSDFGSSPLDRIASEKETPKTPQDTMTPPDASRLSISHSQKSRGTQSTPAFPPATPTADRAELISFADRHASMTPVHGHAPNDVDEALRVRFNKVESIGRGEFSQVFRVSKIKSAGFSPFGSTPGGHSTSSGIEQVFAVKKLRLPIQGQKDRAAKMREVAALQAVRGRENVLQIVDHWEHKYHMYIQTEYCEEGSLDNFLRKVGEFGRLDDFRIWKLLLEVSQGLRYIHDAGFIHLDLKPANIFITYEGHLKIGDFGMATTWPAARGIEGEGDREYMGPEILRGNFDKPADVFALGLIVLEISANVFLPDNGPTWVALREGDLSVVPSLTGSESSAIARDATGMPIAHDPSPYDGSSAGLGNSMSSNDGFPFDYSAATHNASNLFGSAKRSDLEHPPAFMVDQHHLDSLDKVVGWMISPDPTQRPAVHQILEIASVQWVHSRRRAPATVYEGNWGPADSSEEPIIFNSELDTEMTDV